MKKLAPLLFFILLFLLWKQKEVIDPVFKETNYLESPSYCYITFQNKEVNTKNFEKYFQNKTVLSIKPYIKEIYKNKMQHIETYTFTPNTHIDNVNQLEKLYKESLQNSGIKEDIAKTEIYGLPIYEVKILCDKDLSYLNNLSYQIKVRNK